MLPVAVAFLGADSQVIQKAMQQAVKEGFLEHPCAHRIREATSPRDAASRHFRLAA